MTLQHLLNVLVQIANKVGKLKKIPCVNGQFFFPDIAIRKVTDIGTTNLIFFDS
jgi:hypothetical protein